MCGTSMRMLLMRTLLMIVTAMAIAHTSVSARTWYITPDGTGDAPTIQAGVNSAGAGDTVLVAAGTYDENVEFRIPSLVVLSESGPEVTTLVGTYAGMDISAVVAFWWHGSSDSTSVLAGFTLIPEQPQVGIVICSSPTIRSNVIIGGMHGIFHPCAGETSPRILQNTVVGQTHLCISVAGASPVVSRNITAFGRAGIVCDSWDLPLVSCNNAWDHFLAYLACGDSAGTSGNISEDPMFCDPDNGDFHLDCMSPCAPGQQPDCGLIGALGVGCGPTAGEMSTWGLVKSLFRLQVEQ